MTMGIASLLVMFAFEAQAQTLADVSRQERARKQNTQSPITFTNDTTAAPAVALLSPSPSLAATATPVGITDRKGRDGEWWRSAFQQAREELKRLENRVSLAELQLSQASRDLLTRSDIFNREGVVAAKINTRNIELQSMRKEVEQARKKIVDLEQELRRSGGLPGWGR